MKKLPPYLLIKVIIFSVVCIVLLLIMVFAGDDNWFMSSFGAKLIFSAGNIATVIAVIMSICGLSVGKKKFSVLLGAISILSLVITLSSFINLKRDAGESLADYIGNWFLVTLGIFVIAAAIFAIITCVKHYAAKRLLQTKIVKKFTYNPRKLSKTDEEYFENEDYITKKH